MSSSILISLVLLGNLKMLNKKAQMQISKTVEKGAILVIIVVVLFLIFAALVPEAQTAGDSLNESNRCSSVGCFYNTTTASQSGLTGDCANNISGERLRCSDAIGEGIPLSGLFGGSGIVFLLIMVFLLLTILKIVMPTGKK